MNAEHEKARLIHIGDGARKGGTQAEAAPESGVYRTEHSLLEAGNTPSRRTADKVAAAIDGTSGTIWPEHQPPGVPDRNDTTNPPKWFKGFEAAGKYCQHSGKSLANWHRARKLKVFKIGSRTVLIRQADIDEAIATLAREYAEAQAEREANS